MTRTFLLAALVALAAACSSGAKLSVSSASTAADAGGAPAAVPANITLDQVTLVVRHVELEGGPACDSGTPEPTPGAMDADSGDGSHDDGDDDDADDDGESHDDGCELKYGPFPVVIPGAALAGDGTSFEFDVTVPAGDYEELNILVNTIPEKKAGSDATLQRMAAEHASIEITGTESGTPFTCTTEAAVAQEQEPFTVPAEGTNITLAVNASSWFYGPHGEVLTPPTDCDEIMKNVRASLKMFHDDDLDGHDDDGEDHDGDDSPTP
jgi:hypothetical protein